MQLYFSPGACSLGPHIVIRELNLDVELIETKVADRANFSSEFLAVNPRARVPVLVVDGQVYTEASALITYLASLKPDDGLLPPLGTVELARCLEWTAWLSSSLHVAYAQLWRPERFLLLEDDRNQLSNRARAIIETMNQEVENRLAGPWLTGKTYTVADAYTLAFYRWGNRIGIEMNDHYPRWTEWTARMLERPAVRRAVEFERIGFDDFLGKVASA